MVLAALVVVVVALVSAVRTAPARKPSPTDDTACGGTLRVLLDTPIAHWDPQRIYSGAEASLAVRMFARTLTTQGTGSRRRRVASSPTSRRRRAPRATAGAPGPTLAGDAKWQDGRTVTCEDVKYGVSRNCPRTSCAAWVARRMPPSSTSPTKDARGGKVRVPAYAGPYSGAGQALYDKAVTCTGRRSPSTSRSRRTTSTRRSPPSFAPFRKDQDKRGAGNFSVFSCGPYMLEGAVGDGGASCGHGSRSTTPCASRSPTVIDVREGIETTTAIQRIIDDQGEDRYAVTFADAPPALQQQLMASKALASRVTNPDGPTVEGTSRPTSRAPPSAEAARPAGPRDGDQPRRLLASAYGGTRR